MAKLDTNIDLPEEYYSDEATRLMWWVCSLPSYYCRNEATDSAADDFPIDRTWLGPNYWNNSAYRHDTSPGIKFAHTIGSGSTASNTYTTPVAFFSSSATGHQTLIALNKGNGVYNTKTGKNGECLRPGTFAVGDARDPMFFGPYAIDLTLLPNDDGDLLLIVTGSNVLGGDNSGNAYSSDDQRAFNLLFYYTGSEAADIEDLTVRIAGARLQGYNPSQRDTWISNADFSMAFVGASGSGALRDQLMWWPITWDGSGDGDKLNSANNT